MRGLLKTPFFKDIQEDSKIKFGRRNRLCNLQALLHVGTIVTQKDIAAEFVVPRPRRLLIGIFVFSGFIVGSGAVGIFNLFHGTAIIASSLWLGLMGFMLAGFIKEFGLGGVCTNILGEFSLHHFVRVVEGVSGEKQVGFGYRLFGWTRWYLQVPVGRLSRVKWHTGQASSRSGKDMDDWQVGVWYDRDPALSERRKKEMYPRDELFLFGPMGSKELVGELGRSFVKFLNEGGVKFIETAEDNVFVREGLAAHCRRD